MFQMFPLLGASMIIYAVLTLAGVSAADGTLWHAATIISLPIASGDQWIIRGGDIFLIASMGVLFLEIIRTTNTSKEALVNNLLSFLLTFGAIMLFIFMQGFGNSIFAILITMMVLDTMAGMVVTPNAARRDLNVSPGGGAI